ncbi:hypothetical protein JW921_11125 [Candidatus Fermentibacterales bacterium]|nr:hypothetical protein [Candidatus Fermentibacterales bacterium]
MGDIERPEYVLLQERSNDQQGEQGYPRICVEPSQCIPPVGVASAGLVQYEVQAQVFGYYPSAEGWAVRLRGSVVSPLILCDVNEDGDLDVLAVTGTGLIVAVDPTDPPDFIVRGAPHPSRPPFRNPSETP